MLQGHFCLKWPGVLKLAGVVLMGAASMLTIAPKASAQMDPALAAAYKAGATVATSVPGTMTWPAIPPGYNAVTASDISNAQYGIPPRPDPNSGAYAKWVKAVSSGMKRADPNQIRPEGITHGPVKPIGAIPDAGASDKPSTASSSNWSGVASTVKGLKSWSSTKSFYFIYSNYNVPWVYDAINGNDFWVCDNLVDFAAVWNGIDGFTGAGHSDVLQGGTESGVYCYDDYSYYESFYYAWFEWYPNGSYIWYYVNPGDDMFIATIEYSPDSGAVCDYDFTQQIYGCVYPGWPGVYLVGNSAEYIVERPCCEGGYLYPLANYTQDSFFGPDNVAYTFAGASSGKPTYPGSTAATNYLITMWNDQDTEAISTVWVGGLTSLYFYDENCAYIYGCTQ